MVKIIPQEKKVAEKESILVALFFWFSLFIFIVVTTLFFVFGWQTKKAKAQLQEIEAQLEQLGTPEQKALEEAIYDYKRKIDDFPVLLNNHQTPSKLFTLIEENIHPDVWFLSFKFLRDKNQVSLSGKAKSLLALAQQILAFEKIPQIKELTTSNIGVSEEGAIKFELSIIFTPTFLLLK